MEHIFSNIKKFFLAWNIEGFILLSFFLQILLFLLAPLRKKTSNSPVLILIWSAYSAADGTANFVIGLITNSIVRACVPNKRADLLAFWAPFLLLHLGGPDNITAFALEDNELWIRYLFGVTLQALTSLYVFYKSFPSNELWIPTIFLLIAGTAKCVERVRALYLASLDSVRDSILPKPYPRPNFARFMSLYTWRRDARIPVTVQMITPPEQARTPRRNDLPLSDLELLKSAYSFSETFKGLFVDVVFSLKERQRFRNFILNRTAENAFKIVEAELNFTYEGFYTKVAGVRCKLGYILRFIAFISVVIALVFFCVEDKQRFHKSDVVITLILLVGTTALDTLAILMLISSGSSVVRKIIINRQRWFACSMQSPMRILSRRWSESIPQYNFMYYCLHHHSRVDNIFGFLRLSKYLDKLKYVSEKPFTEELRDFIFRELQAKAAVADDLETARKICSARGEWVLNISGHLQLLQWTANIDYDESLLLWHIATELCYATDEANSDNKDFRYISKLLSDYMLYLMVFRPMVTSAVAGIHKIRLRDSYVEADTFLPAGKKLDQREACNDILNMDILVDPNAVHDDGCKTVLFRASILAKELGKLEDREKWEIISKVWVEMLCYAASRCRAYTHAQQLSRGGELLTLVWLLMFHLGLGEQFQMVKPRERAILVFGR